MNKMLKMSDFKNRKLDRRVTRTRRALQGALFALILERGYDAVTVDEITRRADLGRTTFYLHYRDKEDLLMQSVRDQVEGLVNQLAHYPFDDGMVDRRGGMEEDLTPMIVLAFQHVAQNADFYRVLLRGEGTYSAMQRLRQILTQAIAELIQHFCRREKLVLNPQIPMDVFLNSLAGAWIGLMTWWLEEDMKHTPREMTHLFQSLFFQGVRSAIGPLTEA